MSAKTLNIITALLGAIEAEDEMGKAEHGVALVVHVVGQLERIADALEKIATKEDESGQNPR